MSEARRQLYPTIQPYRTGQFDVGDGHILYFELCGNPDGKPVIFLHGGPGSGCNPSHRRLFDPDQYNVLLFDQRGCGRSSPLGALHANTTQHLVEDVERLRRMAGFGKAMLFGGSWGSTLALAYAQAYPAHVSEMILRGIFTGRREELDWYYRNGASRLFPDEWERFLAPLDEAGRGDPIAAYRPLLLDPDRNVRSRAARAWTDWEGRTVSMRTLHDVAGGFGASDHAIAFARIENHFFVHDLWLEEGQLIRDAGRLAGIPGVILQGRYDVVTPPKTAWDLHKAWPGSELQIVEDAGHAYSEPGTLDRLILATDRFAPHNQGLVLPGRSARS
ncbi:prolyl aminopeptidase [Aureimonas sp. Leaf324]|uniref:prolyl aminopeptidase n=1 Tax=Aureimonas sp. Leaf324 TaxID=1736336 RepID=UPI0006FCABA4|nr:prolyl aminopeptidase [Aureimonas sp. Leaf324]KQQ85796.1 proline iminopeptidase [Aureimonas sp. Leaf324]